MRVADRLANREEEWSALDLLVSRIEDGRGRFRRRVSPEDVLRLGELYRSACADLMLAEAFDMPSDTVAYLHALVGRAHNALYRASGFRFLGWLGQLLTEVPRKLRREPTLLAAVLVFYGGFFLIGVACYYRPDLAIRIVGEEELSSMEQMYSKPMNGSIERDDSKMAGFYIQHNASIGLQCYVWGLTLGLGTLKVLAENALTLGAVFGHMFRSPQAENFGTFVTAHAPFELTAIVFSGAAGFRLALGLIAPGSRTRLDALKHAAHESLPIAGAAVCLFVLAAFLEGFVSASPLPYYAKVSIAIASAALLVLYLTLGGRTRAPR